MHTVRKASLFLSCLRADDSDMLQIHCHECQQHHLVGTRSIVSLHNTSEGVVAYVKCPKGHLTLNTGSISSLEKASAGAERSLAPVRKAPVLTGADF